jgi:hypothetical protein
MKQAVEYRPILNGQIGMRRWGGGSSSEINTILPPTSSFNTHLKSIKISDDKNDVFPQKVVPEKLARHLKAIFRTQFFILHLPIVYHR